MNRRVVVILAVLLVFGMGMGTACVPANKPKSSHHTKKIVGETGRALPGAGISIDANYDRRLDTVFDKYILLPVIMKNVSFQSIPMDEKLDRWVIVSEKGKRYTAINTLRHKDPVVWRNTPDSIRHMIEYPEILPINYNVTFDLLFPKGVNLEYFKAIEYTSAAMGKTFILEKNY